MLVPQFDPSQFVVSIISSSHCHLIRSRVLCEGAINLYTMLLFTIQKPGAKEEERLDICEIPDISSLYAEDSGVPRWQGKAVPLQAWSGPEYSRKLSFPDFM
jgi:hypothetical protein